LGNELTNLIGELNMTEMDYLNKLYVNVSEPPSQSLVKKCKEINEQWLSCHAGRHAQVEPWLMDDEFGGEWRIRMTIKDVPVGVTHLQAARPSRGL
jgi:hypothetical protein